MRLDAWIKQESDLGDQTEREALEHQPKHKNREQ